jgi:hypothetical protein
VCSSDLHILLSRIWDFPFRRLLRLAWSRWRYSTPPPHVESDCRAYNISARTTYRTPFFYGCVGVHYRGNVFTEPLLRNWLHNPVSLLLRALQGPLFIDSLLSNRCTRHNINCCKFYAVFATEIQFKTCNLSFHVFIVWHSHTIRIVLYNEERLINVLFS